MGKRFTAVLIVALAVGLGVPVLGGPDPAFAGHGKNCGIVTKGSKDYRVWGQRMKCKRAKKGARLYLREGRGLRGFSCTDDAGRTYVFICGSGGKTYRAQRL